jgi:ABC-type antimicrobial peptide transport system permease subunit
MICEHCGKEISDNAVICSFCGGVTSSASRGPNPNPTTTYGSYPSDPYSDHQDLLPTSTYDQGYIGQGNFTEESSNYTAQAQDYRYGYVNNPPPVYHVPPINITINNYAPTSETNSGALLVEIICSLFGVYGVGWRMAGEKTTGTILLICSFVLFWPLAIFIAIITIGFGIFLCNLPLAIIGIIINAVLLNNTLNRKTPLPIYPTQPQPMRMPPRQMPPQ